MCVMQVPHPESAPGGLLYTEPRVKAVGAGPRLMPVPGTFFLVSPGHGQKGTGVWSASSYLQQAQ